MKLCKQLNYPEYLNLDFIMLWTRDILNQQHLQYLLILFTEETRIERGKSVHKTITNS